MESVTKMVKSVKGERDSRKVADSVLARRYIDTYMAFLATLVSDGEKQECEIVERPIIARKHYLDAPGMLAQFRSNHPQADWIPSKVCKYNDGTISRTRQLTRFGSTLNAKTSMDVCSLTDCLHDLVPGGSGCALQTGLMALGD